MNLTSHFFILYFFPLVISLYLLLLKHKKFRDIFIVLASLAFYSSFGFENLPIFLIPLVFDYALALYLYRSKNKKAKKVLLTIGISLNLAVLGYFKYAGFIDMNLALLLSDFHILENAKNLILPVGISFISFQRISYIIDSYRKKIKPTTNLLAYCVYASLFPHLISGPIVRFSQIQNALSKRVINTITIFDGAKFFSVGLALKIMIANELFNTEELVSKNILNITSMESLIFILYFTLRIYIDFLGYSFMAIGLARFLGFNFPRNFDSPYLSRSITEFWRKWNITLSSWLRDYLYIPLGGNRKGKIRTYLNLLITMLVAGLWHGASWSFVMWGGIHGLLLVIERFFAQKDIVLNLPPKIKNISTMLIIALAWIPFKFTNIQEALNVFKSLFVINFQPLPHNIIISIQHSLYALLIAILISFVIGDGFIDKIRPSKKSVTLVSLILVVTICFSLLRKDVPFIYFQF